MAAAGVPAADAGFAHQFDGVLELCLGFGRKTADEIGAKNRIRPRGAQFAAQIDNVFAAVTASHAFENQIIA